MQNLTIVLCFLLIIGCKNDEVNYDIIIQGKVSNLNIASGNIQAVVNDFFIDENYFTEIDSSGGYKLKVIKYYPGWISFGFNNSSMKIYVHPGESLILNFDELSFPDSGFEFVNSTFPNQLAWNYEQVWKNLLSKKYDSITMHGSFVDFKSFMDSEKKKLDANLHGFIESNKPSEEFISWAQTDIIFHYASELIRYRWLNPVYNGKSIFDNIPSDFNTDFLDSIDIYDLNSLNSFYCNLFLQEYTVKVLQDAIMNGEINPDDRDFVNELYILDSRTEGVIHEYALAYLYRIISEQADWPILDSITPMFLSSLSYRPAIDFIGDRYETIRYFHNNRENLITSANGTSIDTLIHDIIMENRGKLIYIDIWATWCSPCISNMPMLREVQDRFDEDEVSFVGLVERSNEMRAREIISKYDLKGKHYFLSDDQAMDLKELIGYSGIPRYVLIDKEGGFISKNVTRPGKELENQLKSLLEK